MNDTPICPCETPEHPQAISNPPGQDAIAYRVGHYSTFRQALLRPLKEGQPQEMELKNWNPSAKGDLALQMVEWWAYLADILTFYNERVANESYLRTADLTESVRRLIRLLGYRPRPGIGATGVVAALTNARTPFTLPPGFQLQSKPGPGKQPQVFELNAATPVSFPDAVEVDPAPDSTLLADETEPFKGKYNSVLLKGTITAAKVGDRLLILNRSHTRYALGTVAEVQQEKDPRGSVNTRLRFSESFPALAGARATDYRLAKSLQFAHLWPYPAGPGFVIESPGTAPKPGGQPSPPRRSGEWFNVKDFGAVGDGSGDDTKFIQAAIDAAIDNNGGVIYFPPGTYPVAKEATPGVVSAFSLSNVSNLVFLGDGPASTIKIKDGTYLGAFMTFRLLAGTTRITFLSLRFDGNKENIAADEQTHSIEISDAEEIHIERCWFDNTFGDGVRILGRGAEKVGGQPLDTVNKLIIRDCRFKNWAGSGIRCQHAFKQTRITDNLFETNSGDQAIAFEQKGATSPAEIVIDGNMIVHGTETIAFIIGGNQKFIVTNNLIINGSVFGLALQHFTFTNNVIVASASGALPALQLIRHVTDGVIADNIMVSSSTNPQVACVIISINNDIAPGRLLLARNVIQSLTTGINILGANSMQVIDNIIQTNENDDQGAVGIQFTTVKDLPVDNPVLRGNLIRNFRIGVLVVPKKHDIPNADFSHNRLENCTQGFFFDASDDGHPGVLSPQIIGNIFHGVTTDIQGLHHADYLVLGGVGPGSVSIFGGKSTPEGVVPAPVGSMFMRFDGSPDNTLYIKQSGTGKTGWARMHLLQSAS